MIPTVVTYEYPPAISKKRECIESISSVIRIINTHIPTVNVPGTRYYLPTQVCESDTRVYLPTRGWLGGHMRVSARARRALVGFYAGRRPALDERQTLGNFRAPLQAATSRRKVALYLR